MPILPIDLQAILLRSDVVAKLQQQYQDGVAIAQVMKGAQLGELTRIQDERVNQVKEHPEGNTRIEDEKASEKEKRELKKKPEGTVKNRGKEQSEFEDPEKGNIIDTIV
ncbi:MAG: hypothetical protein DRP54_09440 [Spirochaetes bacterium]|nr:MAG: hypothetical protein DRP54_09440 [Spirochaetota bacterium]